MSRFWVWLVAVLQWNVVANSQEIHFGNPKQDTLRNIPSTTATAPISKCGYGNPGALKFRFTPDSLAEYGEFPWMVAIIKKSPNTAAAEWSQQDYTGAGSIIHPSVVISAAHWIGNLKPDEIKCRAGEWDKTSDLEQYEFQERNVNKIAVHPQYYKDSMYNDVSLLFLEKPYDLSIAPQIGPACIGQTLPDAGTECFGMGWGLGSQTMSNVLKKLTVKLLSREDCESKLKKTRLGESFQQHESLICGSSNSGNCMGDDGSSLVCNVQDDNTRFAIYGMSAYRVNDTDAPCVYVNVPQFYEWIGKSMSEEGLTANSYTY